MACSIQDCAPPPNRKGRPPARASLGARARASNLLTAGACAARSWVARRMRLRVAEPSLLVRASGAPSSSRVTACGRERKHGITHRSCASNPVLSAVLYPWNSRIKRASAHPSAPQPRPLHHTAAQTDGTGNWRLIRGDIWPGLFPDIYRFGRTSILAFLFAYRVLFTLLVLREREPPSSASAERFLCVHERVSKFERPPCVTTPVCLRHIRSNSCECTTAYHQGDRSHVPPSHRAATSGRTLRRAVDGRQGPPRSIRRLALVPPNELRPPAWAGRSSSTVQWRACGAGTRCNEDGHPPRAALAAPLPRGRDARVCAARESRGAAWELRPSALRARPPGGGVSRVAARGAKGGSPPSRAMASSAQPINQVSHELGAWTKKARGRPLQAQIVCA